MTAFDTNVLIAIAEGFEIESLVTFLASVPQPFVIAPIVYAEFRAHPGWMEDEVDRFLREGGINVHWSLSREIWRDAGAANARYASRRRGSGSNEPRRIAADFIIGAHATSIGRIVTRDASFFERNFPALVVLDPSRT